MQNALVGFSRSPSSQIGTMRDERTAKRRGGQQQGLLLLDILLMSLSHE